MSRRFITLISAAAIALSGLSFSASTARADDRKTAQWIAGIAAAAIVGAVIIDQKKDRERRKREAVQRQRYYDQCGHGQYRNDQRRAHKYYEKQRKERIKQHRKAHKHDHKHGNAHGHQHRDHQTHRQSTRNDPYNRYDNSHLARPLPRSVRNSQHAK